MFSLIEYMDKATDNYGIDLTLYNKTFRYHIQSLSKDNPEVAKRLENAFDIENLQRNGLIVTVDKNEANQITFQPFLIDMFRHFDNKLIKSLSNAEYEGIRTNFARIDEQLSRTEINDKNDTFNELFSNLNTLLSDTLSLIKRNTDALTGSAERLSDYIDQVDTGTDLDNDSALNKLNELANLYERKVIPSLQFLNTDQRIAKQGTFGKLLRSIEDTLLAKYPKRAASIQYRHAEILSYYKDIKEVERTLLTYYKRHKRSREVFNVMESMFNELRDESIACHDGRLNHNHIPLVLNEKVTSVVLLANPLIGLKSINSTFGTKIQWCEHYAVEDLKEKVRSHMEMSGLESSTGIKDVAVNHGKLKSERAENRRKDRLYKLINSLVSIDGTPDIFKYVHEHLKNNLNDHSLVDALHGYRHFIGKPAVASKIKQTQEQIVIEHKGYKHVYWRRELKAAK